MNWWVTIITTVIMGIVSGVISSIIFFFILRGMKPKIKISDCILCQDKGDERIYIVKVVNETKSALTDLFYSLEVHKVSEGGVIDAEHIDTAKKMFRHIERYDKTDVNATYAIRISFSDKQKIEITDKSYLLFTIFATHSLSGRTVYSKKTYKSTDLKFNCIYETGLSVKVLNQT